MRDLDNPQILALELINLVFPGSQFKKIYSKDDPLAAERGVNHKAPVDNKLYSYEQIKDWNKRIGWLIPKGHVVVDVDENNKEELNRYYAGLGKRVKKVLMSEGLDTIIFDTQNGSHFVFKTTPGVFQTQGSFCRLGVKIDTRVDESGYIIIPHNDPDRSVYQHSLKVPTIPQYLRVERAEFPEMLTVEEGARNGTLFEFMVKLKTLPDISTDEVKQAVTLCNNFILRKPLPEKELARTVLTTKNLERGVDPAKKGANQIALEVLQELKVVTTRQGMYMYNGKYYKPADEYDISRYIHSRYQDLIKDKRKEVFEFIRLKTYRDAEEINSDWRKIVVRNGILNLMTGELSDFNSDELMTRYVDIEFTPLTRETTSGRIDNFLDGLSGGDAAKKQKLLEFIGYCLVSRNKFQKIFFLLGPAATGKSTFLELVRKLFGPSNCSALSMSDLEQQFMPVQLKDKLVNIGDDISMNTLLDAATVKVICGTMPIMVQQKYGTPFEMVNEAKFIFSCNKMPLFKDKTDGLHRRLEIIEITNRIATSDRNTNLLDSFTHEDMQYLLYQSVLAINMALQNDRLTTAVCVDEALEKFRTAQNTALAFMKRGETTNFRYTIAQLDETCADSGQSPFSDEFIGRSIQACYQEYLQYCTLNGKHHQSYENFIDNVTMELNATISKGVFVKNLEA